jgi:hypothetical protein
VGNEAIGIDDRDGDQGAGYAAGDRPAQQATNYFDALNLVSMDGRRDE